MATYIFLATTDTLLSLIYRIPECDIFDGMFDVIEYNQILKGARIQEYSDIRLDLCVYRCFSFRNCKSINFLLSPNQTGDCQLLSKEKGELGVKLVQKPKWAHLQTPPEDQQDKVSHFKVSFTDHGIISKL